MDLGSNGAEMIKSHEGYRSTAYLDIVGVWTIGWGHTATAKSGMTISKAQAQELFEQDVSTAVNAVNTYVVGRGVPLTQNQFDALVSLVFNVGSHNVFTKVYNNGYDYGSILYNKLLAHDFEAAADRFTDFNKAGGVAVNGLTKRRKQEARLFSSGRGQIFFNSVLALLGGSLFYWWITKTVGL